MAKEKAVKATEQPTEPVRAQEKKRCDAPGSVYEGMELPRTRKEARERIELLLGVIRDETQELVDMIDHGADMVTAHTGADKQSSDRGTAGCMHC